MATQAITTYRMGQEKEDEMTGVFTRGVNKVVRKIDGKADYIQLEKEIAPTLEAFREMYPREPVEGAPRGDELKVITGDLTDEQLRELGLTRTSVTEEEDDDVEESVFASLDAEGMAVAFGIDVDSLVPGMGNGAGGKYNTSDIRFLIAKAAQE